MVKLRIGHIEHGKIEHISTYLEIEIIEHIEHGDIEHISAYLEIERNLSRATARMVKREAVRKI